MRLALKHRRIPYAGLLYRGLTCVITAPTSQTMGRAHRRSFLKFVIGTLFHKPAPETRNAEAIAGKLERIRWKIRVCGLALTHTTFPSLSTIVSLPLSSARPRFPARLIILRASNECLLRVISFLPHFFPSRLSHSDLPNNKRVSSAYKRLTRTMYQI